MIQELAHRIAIEFEKRTDRDIEIRAKISEISDRFDVFIVDKKTRLYFYFCVPLYKCKSEEKLTAKIVYDVEKILKEIL